MPKLPRACTCTTPHKTSYLVFALAYANNETGTRSYQLAYPKASYDTARANASNLLASACVQRELAQLRAEMVKASVLDHERELIWNSVEAKQKHDLSAHREAVMDHAKLVGKLVERRQEIALTETPTVFEQQLRQRLAHVDVN